MGQFRAGHGRMVGVTASALVGAMCGGLAAAFGNVISGSVLAGGIVVLAGVGLGWLGGRFPGALIGAIGGAVAVAFGFIVGGTPAGVILTIATGALLAGWVRWARERET